MRKNMENIDCSIWNGNSSRPNSILHFTSLSYLFTIISLFLSHFISFSLGSISPSLMFSFLHFRFFFLISLSFSAFFLFLFYFFYASLIGLCFFVLSVSERERENGRRRTVFVSELKRIIIIMVMLKNRTFTN